MAEVSLQAKIVLTLGGDGSVYSDGTKKIAQHIYKVETVDTTAAGDTFIGYFIAGELKGQATEVSMSIRSIEKFQERVPNSF